MYDERLFVFTLNISNCRQQAADMNVCRYGISTCVIKDLPNAGDYTYKHRGKLMEEKRKKRRRSNVKNVGFGNQ
jgi:hypothetical protein